MQRLFTPLGLLFSLTLLAGIASAQGSKVKLGDLAGEFDAPPLAELEKTVKWVNRPVLDGIVLLRQTQAQEKPAMTVPEALKLRNTTRATNAAILSALGRLPAKDESSEVNYEAEFKRHMNFDVASVNPILASSTVEFDISSLTGIGLFTFDWKFRPFASKDVVVTWQSSADRLYDKVVLRKDLVWSDGQPITAHDVEFSFRLIMTSSVHVPAQRSGTDKLKYVKAYDDHTLIFFHKDSLATNDWNVNFSIIPKHVFENTWESDVTLQTSDAHVKFEKNPVVGGTYKIASRSIGQDLVVERREDYYMHNGKQVRDKPYFKTIRFKFIKEPGVALLGLKGGEIEELQLTPEQWLKQTGDDEFYEATTKAYDTEWVNFQFNWNCSRPYFSDKRCRWAMTYAFDHDELLKKLRYGLDAPADGLFHPASPWHPTGKITYKKRDLEKAEALLDEAGWKLGSNGVREKMVDGKLVKFDFIILVSNRQDRIDTCNLLKQNLSEIGVSVTVRPLEFAVLTGKMQEHDFDASMGGWGTGTDPDTSFNIWGTKQERNYGLYSNPEVDKLFAEGRKEFDFKKRQAIYQKIHTLTAEDQPYTWLYYQNAYYAFNKSLRGYMFSPRGPYHYAPGIGSIYQPAMH
ncbi:MAG: ABC transporter substrate-binding protein [Pirellulaceae bacterium]